MILIKKILSWRQHLYCCFKKIYKSFLANFINFIDISSISHSLHSFKLDINLILHFVNFTDEENFKIKCSDILLKHNFCYATKKFDQYILLYHKKRQLDHPSWNIQINFQFNLSICIIRFQMLAVV